MTDLPLDQAARTTIADDLDRTLFVEAGAGSGKSTALVGRVLELVTTGTARLAEIAAITFTEKAAAELRDRIRQQLERRAADAGAAGDPTVVERCERAIDELDGAAIGTLHAFAQRILAEHPIEVALPPRIEILDEVASEVAFEARWAAYLDDLLTDEDMERTLLLLFATGVKPTALRALATEFDRNWDLVAARVPEDAPAPPPLAGPLAPVLTRIDEICSRVRDCTDGGDRLAGRLGEVAAFTAALREVHDDLDLLDELRGDGSLDVPSFKAGNLGAKKNWTCDHKAIQADLRAAGDDLDAVLGDVAQACAHHLAAALRRFTLAGAEERRRAGELAFHDVRVPVDNIILGEGRGFEISQLRLGPGRIHHCMRSIGAAEKALELMVRRGLNREAFGKPLARLGKNVEVIAKARIEIEAMRLMVLRAARAMDLTGNAEARIWVSAVKAMVPVRVCEIIDEAIQIHGATGISQWTPLAEMYAGQRTLRLADGPDEVHWHVVGRAELTRYEDDHAPAVPPATERGGVFSGP